MMLHLRFLDKTVLITHQCFTAEHCLLAQHQGFLSFSLCPHSEEAGGGQEAGRGNRQNSWSTLTKGIFHIDNIMLSSKTCGRVFPRQPCWLGISQFVGGDEWWPLHYLLFFFFFLFFPFSHFSFFGLSPILLWRCREQWTSSWWVSSYQPGSTYYNLLKDTVCGGNWCGPWWLHL